LARKIRIFLLDTAHHIFLKAIDNIALFKDKEDIEVFLSYIKEIKHKNKLDVHSYILFENSFSLIVTPYNINSISKFMQSLGRLYVRYYNQKYDRAGTLWESRYKLSPIQDKFFLDVFKYLYTELTTNVLTSSKEAYMTKSKFDDLITFHKTCDIKKNFINLFKKDLTRKQKIFIENALNKENILGSEKYIKNLEKELGKTIFSKKRGRPKKNNIKGKMMYKKPVVLDKKKHKNIKINQMQNLEFAKELTYLPILSGEVEVVAKTFPVVFSSDKVPSIIALISLGERNLALNSEYKWIGEHIPLFLRRYPFSLAVTNENQKIVLIDENSKLFSDEKGSPLFDKNGNQTDNLKNAINFLNQFDSQVDITNTIAKIIADSGILEEREITIGEGEELKTLVKGFKVVNKEKLYSLDDVVLAEWVRKGIMTIVEAHLKSLDNIDLLFKLSMQK